MWFAAALRGWLQHEQGDLIAFLREENRVLKAQLRGRRLRLSDPERRRLATLGHRLGRRTLTDVATIVSPDTILRWHRELVVRQSTYARCRGGRLSLKAQIRLLVVRMAGENATWGLHAHPRRAEEPRTSNGPIHDCRRSEGWCPTTRRSQSIYVPVVSTY
jgi:hypothetical protein